MADYLAIYLNDHLAGSTVGRELSKRAAGENRGTEFGDVLQRLHEEIVEDRQSLLDIMRALDVGEDHLKAAGALVMERLGRLKLNGQLFSYSPLSRLVELEGLALGVHGKSALWRSLQHSDDPRLAGFDLAGLEARAMRQLDEIEDARLKAARIAFQGRTP
ncbi:MAG: hypothetical protein QOF37_2741 [Thermoleophilaceae bacterium]|jgi:hypothetical protein|nr:hypothetical protein [Thermoleophilaceae bacterium]